MEENKALATQTATANSPSIFSNTALFEDAQRFAKALCESSIVPTAYQKNIPNTLVALEMANRMGESPLMIMQNLDIIHGKPSFNSKFVIARLNTCGKFSPLRFEYSGEGDKRQCIAVSTDSEGKVLHGPPCSVEMAKKEGWWTKNGSKWPTMTDLMLMYRCATFFGRMYAPELSMGMQTTEEIYDITPTQNTTFTEAAPTQNLNDKIKSQTANVVADKKKAKVVRKAAEPVVITPTEPSAEPNAEGINDDYL